MKDSLDSIYARAMRKNSVIVTGSSGFIGHCCCKSLEQNGFNVITAGRSADHDIFLDLSQPRTILNLGLLPDFDAFMHLGAYIGLDGASIEDMYSPNVLSTALIADFVAKRNSRLIFASTAIIAGLNTVHISVASEDRPDNPYAYSKQLAELCVKASGVSSAIFRIGGVYGFKGPHHLGLNRTIQEAFAGKPPVIFGDGSGKRNYVYVKDLASILVQAVKDRVVGTHLVSGSEELTIAQMYHSVCDIFGLDSGPRFDSGDSSSSQIILASQKYSGQSSFVESLESIRNDYASSI